MTYIKVNDTLYPAAIEGRMADHDWDDRQVKSITLEGTCAGAAALLPDGAAWSIVQRDIVPKYDTEGKAVLDEEGNAVMEERENEWDNSEYSMSGDITDHRDGTVTIRMGKPTELENAYEMLIGG